MGWDDGTIVVVTADHGEEFGDHGGGGHAHSLFSELLRVPLVFHAPHGRFTPRHVSEPVSLLDVLPTLRAPHRAAGRPRDEGVSLAGLLRGATRASTVCCTPTWSSSRRAASGRRPWPASGSGSRSIPDCRCSSTCSTTRGSVTTSRRRSRRPPAALDEAARELEARLPTPLGPVGSSPRRAGAPASCARSGTCADARPPLSEPGAPGYHAWCECSPAAPCPSTTIASTTAAACSGSAAIPRPRASPTSASTRSQHRGQESGGHRVQRRRAAAASRGHGPRQRRLHGRAAGGAAGRPGDGPRALLHRGRHRGRQRAAHPHRVPPRTHRPRPQRQPRRTRPCCATSWRRRIHLPVHLRHRGHPPPLRAQPPRHAGGRHRGQPVRR